jgi:hypothetical protein
MEIPDLQVIQATLLRLDGSHKEFDARLVEGFGKN